jgi:endonuclease YncB( thermonuclease family)
LQKSVSFKKLTASHHLVLLNAFLSAYLPITASNLPTQPNSDSPNHTNKCPVENCVKISVDDCHDGDTCHVLTIEGLRINVRLAGIDAPEVGRFGSKKQNGQPLGQEARAELLKILRNNSDLTMKQLDLDPFNRPIVELYAGRECVNLKLLEMGLAERYRGKSKSLDSTRYDVAESLAKKEKRGIWGLSGYKSPSKWRKEQKN